MQAMTDDEVRAFIKKNEWATGLKVDAESQNVYYDNAESNCIELKFPEKPMEAPYFARVASLLNLEREELFYGAVLWLTLWDIGSPQLEKTGWKMVEKMRLAFGETRPIGAAPGHSFRSDEIVELNAFLAPCFVFWVGCVSASVRKRLLCSYQSRRILGGCYKDSRNSQALT